MNLPIVTVALVTEQDVVSARQRARQVAELLGFDHQDQIRVATCVSEIARNAFRYGTAGSVAFSLEGRTAPQLLQVLVSDRGPGFAHVSEVLNGRYRSRTGMGLGITGSRRLMDHFSLESVVGRGTTVTLGKLLPSHAPFVRPEHLVDIVQKLSAGRLPGPLDEVQRQNAELMRALEELRRRNDDLNRLNGELEDTNRGVLALYAELDEKADHLRRADEMKSKFLSNMSHEFRTPLNSMLALTRLLLDRTDGDLNDEQDIQVRLIRKASEDLFEIVNDLLDLAKVEAGKIIVRPGDFGVANLFGALRGMLRPLLVNETLSLVFEEPVDIPLLHTDEGKVSQIVRNFISNALKFTEHGEIRVSASYAPETGMVTFAVTDTGIGIHPSDHERIFQEFTQIEHPLQRRTRGTGLGLPLSRKLAELLGGRLTVTSTPGVGSTFSAVVPAVYRDAVAEARPPAPEVVVDPALFPLLVVEDSPEDLLIYDRIFRNSAFQIVPARSVRDARRALTIHRPAAVILDVVLSDGETWELLGEIKKDPATSAIPVIWISAVDDGRKAVSLGADAWASKPVDRQWLLNQLTALLEGRPLPHVLLIDDDPAARYLLKRHLAGSFCAILEAGDGAEGYRLARDHRPAAIVLDLLMPGLSGLDVLTRLRADEITAQIPVIIATSKMLAPMEHDVLAPRVSAILPKDGLFAGGIAAEHLKQALQAAGVVTAA